jgi:DNA-binding transcriptional MerR regulator
MTYSGDLRIRDKKMRKKGFRTGIVRDLTGLSYHRIDYYDKNKLVSPEVQKAGGRGKRRLYSRENLSELNILKKLRDRGLSLFKIKRAVKLARKRYPSVKHPLQELSLFTDGNTLFVYEKEKGQIVDLLNLEQSVLTPAVRQISRALDYEIKTTPEEKYLTIKLGNRKFFVEVSQNDRDGNFTASCPELFEIKVKHSRRDVAIKMIREKIAQTLRQIS